MLKPVPTALAITGVLALYLAGGMVLRDDDAPETRPESQADSRFSVQVQDSAARPFTRQADLRGRTQAIREVTVMAEVAGRVEATPTTPGAIVSAGDILCRLAPDEREAELAEARATLAQREQEMTAARRLFEGGHRSSTQLAAAEAALEAARALVSRRQIALDNTRIRAPFDGIFDRRMAEVGSYLRPGEACGRLVSTDPYLAVGEVAGEDVSSLSAGGSASVEVAGLGSYTGTIRSIAAVANTETRAFRVEVLVDNADGRLKSGLAADISLDVAEVSAHRAPASALVLDSEGALGVRTVDPQGQVRFHRVSILADDDDGLWLSGLPDQVRIITVGQNFVTAGETVRAVSDADTPAGDAAVSTGKSGPPARASGGL
ncbi:efflux RND transporter periplasmic adaptor subunit [Yunchengibacter salinarum]|uniref:efflux RND transporter periplasmic adaptor subunit n=1 Tax=Yunchengibacter salinarum TaxID=3133399 RepID=UPI0035B681F5